MRVDLVDNITADVDLLITVTWTLDDRAGARLLSARLDKVILSEYHIATTSVTRNGHSSQPLLFETQVTRDAVRRGLVQLRCGRILAQYLLDLLSRQVGSDSV